MKQTTPEVHSFFDEATNAACYIVKDPSSPACAIIDSILDFDIAAGRTHTTHADTLIATICKNGWQVEWIIETHVHADHLSAAPYLAGQVGGKIAIGANIAAVQAVFGKIFNAGTEFEMDGSQFDRLFKDGDCFAIGNLDVVVMHTPGHTPACVTYVIGDAAFIGDTLFMPDFGTARADFPGGSATDLYTSIQRILALPGTTRLFLCHDYKTASRDTYCWETTVAEQKASNIHVGGGKSESEFVDFRTQRDAQLAMPKLIIPSIQVNMRAGKMPPSEDDGNTYLKVPINRL
ncbi:MBL fold metallo-hydrolase [Ruegeria atlantica]|uniref:Beta-lactamase hydrolase-like protein n=1 Tax=Ruegeria atlantica TaxID=81569 RepID=A0A0P1EAH5_9RHOB|nr:MBL fold metallo-hydrolase [Ruegeria atlantica]CUH45832.1 Beta-lactamase hydrolase-like protein [Ruegeria atlantica]CUH48803.1 Beta-lactamase hydrolase-like protein [Ruegeria atlantica]